MTYRYLFFIEAERTDIQVVYADKKHWQKLIGYFNSQGQPIFMRTAFIGPRERNILLKHTPPAVAEVGFALVNPQVPNK